MDRQIVYPGAIPRSSDILQIQRATMVALGAVMQATMGTAPVVDGLVCSPSAVGIGVVVGPGCISQYTVVDQSAFGTLASDTLSPLLKVGINTRSTVFDVAAPTVAGQSVNILIEASFAEVAGSPLVLPYYNSSNPGQPFAGPSGAGAAQNTVITQYVALQAKAGVPAAAGSQTTPSADAGWSPLYVITLNSGETAVVPDNISVAPGAPFVPTKLPYVASAGSLANYASLAGLNAETAARIAADDTERQARIAADDVLHSNITDVNSGRLAGDTALGNRIDGLFALTTGAGAAYGDGWARLGPSLIVMWGQGALPATGGRTSTVNKSFPTAFPGGIFSINISIGGNGEFSSHIYANSTQGIVPSIAAQNPTQYGFQAVGDTITGASTFDQTVAYNYIAIGY